MTAAMQVRDDSGVEHDSNHEAEWLQVSVDVLKVELMRRIWVYDRRVESQGFWSEQLAVLNRHQDDLRKLGIERFGGKIKN